MEELEARFDGPIPRSLRRAAAAADHAGRVIRRARVRARVKNLNAGFAVDTMVSVMMDAHRDRGVVTREDLLRAGFADADIARHGAEAARLALAQARPDRQVADA